MQSHSEADVVPSEYLWCTFVRAGPAFFRFIFSPFFPSFLLLFLLEAEEGKERGVT